MSEFWAWFIIMMIAMLALMLIGLATAGDDDD